MLRAKAPFKGILKALCCLISVRLHVLESKGTDADVLLTEKPLSGPVLLALLPPSPVAWDIVCHTMS